MRGKRFFHVERRRKNGITPADAGKTYDWKALLTHAQDHPRGCGENKYNYLIISTLIGSPPRMRGKLNSPEVRIADHRITPADAGKTDKGIFYSITT